MQKKLIALLTSFGLMCNIIVYAEGTSCSFDNTPGTGIMTGVVLVTDQEYPSMVTVRVSDAKGELNYFDVIYTDESGKGEFSFVNTGSSGDYTCSFYVYNTNETISSTYKDFKDSTFRKNFVIQIKEDVISNNEDSLKEHLSGNDYWLKTDKEVYEMLSNQDSIYSIMISDYSDFEDAADVKKLFERATYLEYVNEKGESGVELLYNDDTNNALFDLKTKIPSKIYDELSTSTKKAIRCAMGKNYKTSSSFCDDFVCNVLCSTIKNAANYNEVKSVLDAYKNAGFISYTRSLVNNDYKALVGKNVNSYSDVEKAIANLSNNPTGGGSNSGSGGGGGGGGGTPTSVTVTSNIEEEKQPQIESNQNKLNLYFDDIEDSKWALEAINCLCTQGIINGTGYRTYEPNRVITRAEMSKLMVVFAGAELIDKESKFVDVPYNCWYSSYVNTAVAEGFFKGYNDNTFAPEAPITREEAALVVYRYLKLMRKSFDKTTFIYTDQDSISDWSAEAIYGLYAEGVMKGRSNEMFYPAEYISRAESAVLLYNALNVLK